MPSIINTRYKKVTDFSDIYIYTSFSYKSLAVTDNCEVERLKVRIKTILLLYIIVFAFIIPSATTLNRSTKSLIDLQTDTKANSTGNVSPMALSTYSTVHRSPNKPVEVPIYPWENKSIPSAVVTAENKLYIATALHIHITPDGKTEQEYIPLPSKVSNDTLRTIIQNYAQDSSRVQIESSSNDVTVDVTGPAYWERDSTVYIQVTFTKEFTWPPSSFHYAGHINCYVKDKYFYESGWYWVTEESGSMYVDFTLTQPGESKTFNVPVQVGHTTVGLKKVVVTVPGLGISVDEGYVFVQKINVAKEIVGPINPSNPNEEPKNVLPYLVGEEDPLGATDLHHPNTWYRLAAEAADAIQQTDVTSNLGGIARRIANWVNSHFIYTKTYNGSDLVNYSASDTWLINHRDENGMFHGVCDEYATLFVSFARAMNLPAREIGLGGVDWSNAWLGHETVEVWAQVENQYYSGYYWIHIELVVTVYYDPPLPSFYRTMFKSITDVYVLTNATEPNSIKTGLLISSLSPDNYEIKYKNYEGPNNYKF